MGRVVAVIILCFVYCVLPSQADDESECANITSIAKNKVHACFKTLVEKSLGNIHSTTCQNVNDFASVMALQYNHTNELCNKSLIVENKDLIEFIDFSLNNGTNGTFIDFKNDLKCVDKIKSNLTMCLKNNTGLINETIEIKDIHFYSDIELKPEQRICNMINNVKKCAVSVLNSCKLTTRQYVSSLFDFTMKNCNFTNSEPQRNAMNPAKNGQSASTLIIVISVISVVITLGIISVLLNKLRQKFSNPQ